MNAAVVIALALVIAGALYIHLRWRRAPQAYHAMIALAACYFAAGYSKGCATRPSPYG